MVDGGMAGDEVDENVHPPLVRLVKETLRILIGAVARGDLLVVSYIVSGIAEGRIVPGIHPHGVAAQVFDIVEAGDHARDIADAVAVGILEGLRIDLIKHSIRKPCGKPIGCVFHRFFLMK